MSLSTVTLSTIDLRKKLDKQHSMALRELARIKKGFAAGQHDCEEGVDVLAVLREARDLIEDTRKLIDGAIGLIVNRVSYDWIQRHLNDEEVPTIRGSLASGTVDSTSSLSIPSMTKDPENYHKLMRHFGVNQDAYDEDLVRPHWPALCDHVSMLLEEGKRPPPGIDPSKVKVKFKVTTRMKKR